MTQWRRRLLAVLPLVPTAGLVLLVLRATPADDDPPGLHSDAHVRGLAPFDIAAATRAADSILRLPWLDVVPAGETRTRGDVFRALGLDGGRVGVLRSRPVDKVHYLWWQVSPSYDLCCVTMVLVDEPRDLTDPGRPVYGVRLVSRPDATLNLTWGF